jgi:hypothetical protein
MGQEGRGKLKLNKNIEYLSSEGHCTGTKF